MVNSLFDITGKKAIVTGGTRGLGGLVLPARAVAVAGAPPAPAGTTPAPAGTHPPASAAAAPIAQLAAGGAP